MRYSSLTRCKFFRNWIHRGDNSASCRPGTVCPVISSSELVGVSMIYKCFKIVRFIILIGGYFYKEKEMGKSDWNNLPFFIKNTHKMSESGLSLVFRE